MTEAAALACARWVGFGDKIAADQAAVDAMRHMLADGRDARTGVGGDRRGQKDAGARCCSTASDSAAGHGVALEVAVDPLEGTDLVARGGSPTRSPSLPPATARPVV